MIRGTEAGRSGPVSGRVEGLRYPVAFTVARAARDPDDRHGPERDQDGTA
jgi:hypothetical protein